MAASGGTPRQARRVILATAVVLGASAAVAGAVLGVGVGAGRCCPAVQRMSRHLVRPVRGALAAPARRSPAFGLLSALLAAVVPAWIASRQDVVAVLAGRRGDRRPSLRSPLVGAGPARRSAIARCAVPGPHAGQRRVPDRGLGDRVGARDDLPGAGRRRRPGPVSGRLPAGPLRYAVRDAARHRTRTVPAVAAVAATVAGVVALGIANTSDAAQGRATTNRAAGRHRRGVLLRQHPDWPSYADLVRRSPRRHGYAGGGIGEAPADAGHGVRPVGAGPRSRSSTATAPRSGPVSCQRPGPAVGGDGGPAGRGRRGGGDAARGGAVVFSQRPGRPTGCWSGSAHGSRAWVPALYVASLDLHPVRAGRGLAAGRGSGRPPATDRGARAHRDDLALGRERRPGGLRRVSTRLTSTSSAATPPTRRPGSCC